MPTKLIIKVKGYSSTNSNPNANSNASSLPSPPPGQPPTPFNQIADFPEPPSRTYITLPGGEGYWKQNKKGGLDLLDAAVAALLSNKDLAESREFPWPDMPVLHDVGHIEEDVEMEIESETADEENVVGDTETEAQKNADEEKSDPLEMDWTAEQEFVLIILYLFTTYSIPEIAEILYNTFGVWWMEIAESVKAEIDGIKARGAMFEENKQLLGDVSDDAKCRLLMRIYICYLEFIWEKTGKKYDRVNLKSLEKNEARNFGG
ncbi:hypothetical protein K402DRAFT_397809 [Aulographum hederae CBS 113979]|uniref:Uncharacterized protein n=1 Tax=Aulographum hederae CBS 113979 TaxID=1176131 RepID=A0A6G1GMN2_9PEZI|nr:hypothetical protein K402DRAFT_397809 [Aulographum hederae CBS 113979]